MTQRMLTDKRGDPHLTDTSGQSEDIQPDIWIIIASSESSACPGLLFVWNFLKANLGSIGARIIRNNFHALRSKHLLVESTDITWSPRDIENNA